MRLFDDLYDPIDPRVYGFDRLVLREGRDKSISGARFAENWNCGFHRALVRSILRDHSPSESIKGYERV